MTVMKVIALVAVVVFFCLVYFKLVRWIVREWKRIEAEEEGLRQTKGSERELGAGN